MPGMSDEQITEINQRTARLLFLVPLGEAAENGRIIEVELKQKADLVDLGQLIGTAVPALLAEVKRLTGRVADLEEDSTLLDALRAAGVDNWDGYSYAHELLDEWRDGGEDK